MKKLLASATLVGFLQIALPAQQTQPSNAVEKAFSKGGRVHLDLSAGDYTIRGSMADAVRVRWETRHERDMRSAGADVTIEGTKAMVRTRGPKNNFRVTIDLPQRVDLDIDLSAGDLKVNGIEGNKTLSMWAGDVTIEVGEADLYKRVDATVRAGEISARPFGKTTGGLFRSLHWQGGGKYTLNAKLTAGDLKLVK
jgi:phage baseplate assembly protein gpV